MTHFADRIIFPYEPRQIFLRAGWQRPPRRPAPDEVAADFAEFVRVVHDRLPTTEILYIGVNPIPSRSGRERQVPELNKADPRAGPARAPRGLRGRLRHQRDADGRARPELFRADRLHFNAEGYKLSANASAPT